MKWRPAVDHALIGLLGYGSASFFLSHDLLKTTLAALLGSLLHGGWQALRHSGLDYVRAAETFEWYRKRQPKAYVTLRIDGPFLEVSEKKPENGTYLVVARVGKQDLFDFLKGKRIDWGTIPYPLLVKLEREGCLALSKEALQNLLRVL